jgi:hypothetical protein
MKRIYLISAWLVVFFLGATSLPAQAPFTGGLGDGYAQVSLSVGMSTEEASLKGIRLAPSPLPAGTPLWLTQEGQLLQEGELKLFDPSGRQLFSCQVPERVRQAIALPPLPAGLYLIELKGAQGQLHRKLLIE